MLIISLCESKRKLWVEEKEALQGNDKITLNLTSAVVKGPERLSALMNEMQYHYM